MEQFGNTSELRSINAAMQTGYVRQHNIFECKGCYNSGFRVVPDPHGRVMPDGAVYPGVVRCDQCRYWEFRRQAL